MEPVAIGFTEDILNMGHESKLKHSLKSFAGWFDNSGVERALGAITTSLGFMLISESKPEQNHGAQNLTEL